MLGCFTSTSCLITQTTGGLISGMLLFLVAAGLSLIFGTLKVINTKDGSTPLKPEVFVCPLVMKGLRTDHGQVFMVGRPPYTPILNH